MSKSTATLPQFQSYMWELLPARREALGREVIDDIVILAVQFWPNEELSSTVPDTEAEAELLRSTAWAIRRVLEFVYGEVRFQGVWLLGANVMVPKILDLMLAWWRRRKDNRAKVAIWRRKWTNE